VVVETKGRAAEQGDDFHQRIAPVVDVTLPVVDKAITTKWLRSRLEHAAYWIGENSIAGWRAEVAYAYNPQTGKGRTLGYNLGREYEKAGLAKGELAGSADIAVLSGDTVVVFDWKTGRTIGAGAEAQLEWLALFAARATGAWYARTVALHVTESGVFETEWYHDDVSLWRIAEQLKIDVEAIDDAWPTPGSHCENLYCGARANCEPYQQLFQLHRKEAS
jgi:hypothetical protein